MSIFAPQSFYHLLNEFSLFFSSIPNLEPPNLFQIFKDAVPLNGGLF